tara:strand:- start:2367 stop:4040 length:1674 start_codon:yes stop_codon:yes gene_type:complete
MLDFSLFTIFYFICINSIIGYGLLFKKVFLKENLLDNYSYTGFYGIFFLIIYSYISHFFLAHNFHHNVILITIGFLFYLVSLKALYKNRLFFLPNLIFLIFFITFFIFKTHDDFPYYHFPYTYYLTQNSMIIGTGQVNHGFLTPSSLFYINSLFYLPFVEYYMFNLFPVLIMGFANLFFINKILNFLDKKKIDYIFYLSLLFLLFVNIFFYRIQEHGTDKSAQILIFIFLIEIFILIKFFKNYEKNINNIIILLGIILSLKSFYFLYLIFLLPFLLILILEKKIFIINKIIFNKLFYIFISLIIIILFQNFLNSSCLVYPVFYTCFDSLDWSFGSLEVMKMNNWYEQWSKAGAGPNFRVENPAEYIDNFNWVSNWFKMYFFNKISDFLLGLIFLFLILGLFFNNKIKFKSKVYKNDLIIYSFILLLFVEWFYNHPALRYGGYCLIVIILSYPFSLFLEKNKINLKNFKKKVFILICISFLILFLRNVNRISDEVVKYNYQPIKEPFYRIDEVHFRTQKEFNLLINNYENCIKKIECDEKLHKKVKRLKFGNYLFKLK